MSAWIAIVAMGIGIYAVRTSGLVMPDLRRIERWKQLLDFLPPAILGALFVATLLPQTEDRELRLIAVLVAGLISYLIGRAWICILTGLALFWMLRLF